MKKNTGKIYSKFAERAKKYKPSKMFCSAFSKSWQKFVIM